jgi:hypothetical protein
LKDRGTPLKIIKETEKQKNILTLQVIGVLNGSTACTMVSYLASHENVEQIIVDDSKLRVEKFGEDVLRSRLKKTIKDKIKFQKIII